MKCCHCGTEKEAKAGKSGEKLPRGWKRHQERTWCDACWSDNWMLRAVTIPVSGPVDGTWDELRATLRACWQQATTVANWATKELYKAEETRRPGMERMPKAPSPYLYPGARAICPEMDPQSVTAVLHAVEGKYRKRRLQVNWFQAEALPTFRYPTPYPVHNQGWSASRGEGGEALVSVRLGGRRWSLRLRGGHEFRRQLGAFDRLVAGDAVAGELAIYAVDVTRSAEHVGIEGREPGGANSKMQRVMAKMVMWLPKSKIREADGTLCVRTGCNALWTYHVGNDGKIKYLNADHVRRWVAEHIRTNRRMADDLKYEKRWPTDLRRRMVESQDARLRKQRNRLESFCHESTAMLAKFAARQRVATVVYDDTDQSYVEKFPWHMLREMLRYKLDERGIVLEVVKPRERECG